MSTKVNTDYIRNLIGSPWIAGARGPEAYDCWGLFLEVQRTQFNRELPEIPVDALNVKEVLHAFSHHPERQRWQKVKQPVEGDAILMRQARYPVHIGVWLDIDSGGVLHAVQHAGVVYQTPKALEAHGWRIEGNYSFQPKEIREKLDET
jgi:hypothetical protein